MKNLTKKKIDFFKIKIILVDCDGILTDGSLFYSEKGEEFKMFSAHDGLGIRLLSFSDISFGVLTGRFSPCLTKRCKDLGVDMLFQNIKNKREKAEEILSKLGLNFQNLAYMGDDINDLSLLKAAGFAATSADSQDEILEVVDWVSKKGGGRGCVRSLIDLVLKKSHKFYETQKRFTTFLCSN